MAVDLLIRNANLPDGREGVDIACSGGKITAIETGIAAEAGGSSTPPAAWCRRPSSTATSTWTRRCPSASRA